MVPKIGKTTTPVKAVESTSKTECPVNVFTISVGVQTVMKGSECQTERATTNVHINSTKEGFIDFITEVVNCTAQAGSRSEKIHISAAAFKHLGWEEFTFKTINKIFSQSTHKRRGVVSRQSQDSPADSC